MTTAPVRVRSNKALDELDRLPALIRSTHQEAEAEADLTRKQANKAITAALLCGKYLNRAKRLVGHGGWLKWLKEHCKAISEDTAQRYMKLSKTAHVRDLGEPASLRQAYIGAGIISKTKNKLPPEQQPEVWQEVVETAPDGKITGTHVQAVVDKIAPQDEPGEDEPFTTGMVYARFAIESLERIPPGDKEREQAFNFVEQWLNENRKQKAA